MVPTHPWFILPCVAEQPPFAQNNTCCGAQGGSIDEMCVFLVIFAYWQLSSGAPPGLLPGPQQGLKRYSFPPIVPVGEFGAAGFCLRSPCELAAVARAKHNQYRQN